MLKIILDYSEDVLKTIMDRNIPIESLLRDALAAVNVDEEVEFTKEETGEPTKGIKEILTINKAVAIYFIAQAISSIQINGVSLECVAIHPKTGEVIRDNKGNPVIISKNIESTISLPGEIVLQIRRSCEKND